MTGKGRFGAALIIALTAGTLPSVPAIPAWGAAGTDRPAPVPGGGASPSSAEGYYRNLALAAEERTRHRVVYDPSYTAIPYPGGDVPADRGVCTDVIVRSYRKMGADLQVLVHEDMSGSFERYPTRWGLTEPDPNIDHRRVPNLMTFFGRHGTSLPLTTRPGDYLPGDIVAWDLGGGVTHIGIVSATRSRSQDRYLIVHNIGGGTTLEDRLFDWKVIGHYRYGAEPGHR